ncbi:hypothetical protein GO988_23050 [Hymenobacter sp. HMF4947]|uniref:Uncharacterized protein n=1 Tax=Hymenobacter ginkgonis TaxID=2682976 RepID=A0A7K1TLE0_9BACT|nr:hypothetical protein [Hymenobacter ginkgonis]MVN79220.1 hypothetical protein [Hymenobacter ginkgonis]
MNPVFRTGWLLGLAVACTPASPPGQTLPQVASREEMAVIQAVIQTNELLADHQLFGQALSARPLFSQVLPLAVRSNNQATRAAEFEVRLADLLRHTYSVQGQRLRFFTSADSSAVVPQWNGGPRRLDSTQFALCDLLTPASYRLERQQHVGSHYRGPLAYQQFSQPLFSADETKAYIQLDAFGSGRTAYLLVKKGSHWEQVASHLLWVE